VCVILSAVGYFAGLRPLLVRQDQLAAVEVRLDSRHRDVRQRADSVANLADSLARTKRALAESPVQLQPARDINAQIARLAKLASECGMKIDEIQPAQPSSGPRFQTVPIHFVGRGDFRTCVQLMHRVREAFPDTAVASFKLTGNPRNPDADAQLILNLLWCATKPPTPNE